MLQHWRRLCKNSSTSRQKLDLSSSITFCDINVDFFFSCYTIIKQWSLGKGDTSDAPASKCDFVYFIFVRVAIVINVFIVNILIYTYLLFINKIFILISFFFRINSL